MPEESTISVNFGRPMPVLPRNSVVLLPHGIWTGTVDNPSLTQLVSDALDGAGQIALAVYKPGAGGAAGFVADPSGDEFATGTQAEGSAGPVRSAVCIGQILRHHKFADGRYALVIQGICRAAIVNELPSEAASYRKAMLEPVGLPPQDESELRACRDRIGAILSESPMTDLRDAAAVVQHLADDDVPTTAILDLIALAFLPDNKFRYNFLAEGDARRRAEMVILELEETRALLKRASAQRLIETPKGCCWN